MKKLLFGFALATMVVFGACTLHADTFHFEPNPSGFYIYGGFDHYTFYTWGPNVSFLQSYIITSATITIHDLYNWTTEPNILYIDVLSGNNPGIWNYWDNQAAGDAFQQSQYDSYWKGDSSWQAYQLQRSGVLPYVDPIGGPDGATDLVYAFDDNEVALLNNLLQAGGFQFGFDPDCRFFTSLIEVNIEATPIPEPATVLLYGSALLGIALLQRRKRAV